MTSNGSWQKVRFDEICKNISKRIDDPKQAETDYYVGLEHLDSEDPKISRHGSPQDVSKTKLIFKSGHILFGRRNWYLRRLAVAQREGICSAHMMVLEHIDGKCIKEFVPLLMFSDDFYEKALMVSAGSMSPTIKWKDIATLEFLIPSIEQQENILSITHKIDQTISDAQNLLEKTKNYLISRRESLLTRGIDHKKFKKVPWLFGKEIEIPEEWSWERLEDNSTLKGRIGWQGLTTAEYLDKGEFYLVTGTDFKDGKIDWKNCVYVNEDRYSQDQNIQLKKEDVLITKDGTIGKIAYIDSLPCPTTLNTGVFVVRPINKKYLPKFFFDILNSNYFVKFLNSIKAGSTINHLYQKDFVNFNFPVPSLDEQQKIVSTLSEIKAHIAQQQSHLINLKALRKSILNSKLTKEKTDVTN